MAGESEDDDQKTEEPTQRKLDEARKKGQIARSAEMRHVAMLGGALVVVSFMAGGIGHGLAPMFVNLLGQADKYQLDGRGTQSLASSVALNTGAALFAPLAVLFLAAIVGGVMQGRPTLSWERIKPQWSKLSPLSGIKRLLGAQAVVEFLKTLAKSALVGVVGVAVVWPYGRRLELSLFGSAPDVLALTGGLVIKLLLAVVILVAVLSLGDFVYQRFSFMKKMRMSRQELKDEFKQSEGDPHVKARIRQIRLERSRKRMMANVPTADVVITNPTHFAVALKYDQAAMAAPKVVAKGVDSLALRIRAVATENKVPIVENPPLARALYASVEVEEEIKPDHYKAVAEVISYVMKLRGRSLPKRPPRP
ncbi:flagellar biosynthesis protein FlhB [Pedomonas mirosovicensis]|uniref:flagellar biosynthesis protein FlhB n=1 Tax=Pedomonas mirosovicensis TaxID=2908641 RepID=UPI00216A4EAA|nr:flagellar biosynthesis protein FlhB [Pedomonas mirosovicensis]MCH8685122.1 flagellar biosynthesis protein FlhB [Pedomonas mirosovicensis]